jgi:fucose permease
MVQHGIVLIINGPLVPSYMESFGVGESTIGFYLAMGSVGFLMGPLIAGTIIDRVGIGAALGVGLGIELTFFLIFGFSRAFAGIVVANAMARLGASFLETGGNVMPTLIAGKRTAHARMNLVHVFFSIGAFVGPFLVGLYVGSFGAWRPVFFFAMIPTALILVWIVRTRLPRRSIPTENRKHIFHDLAATVRSRATMLGALSLLLYVGAEVGISNWLVLYLQRYIGMTTVVSASGLSLLWLGIMIGRYLNSLAGNRYSARSLVAVSGIGGCIGMGVFLLSGHPVTAFLLIGWLGLCLAGVFPNIMAELNNRNPDRAGTVTAVMAIGASFGAAIFQAVVGAVAGAVSLKAAFLTLGIVQAVVVVTFYLALKPARERR